MVKDTFARQTRLTSSKQFGGAACELDYTNPSTFRQVINYYHFLKKTAPDSSLNKIVDTIFEKLVCIWEKVNPSLPLMKPRNIKSKVKKTLMETDQASCKRLSTRSRLRLCSQLDTLFDISACQCNLPKLPCSDRNVKCSQSDCNVDHIGCLCPSDKKVPILDRLYLKDQRQKIGSKGKYQLSTVDHKAPSTIRAVESRVSVKLIFCYLNMLPTKNNLPLKCTLII